MNPSRPYSSSPLLVCCGLLLVGAVADADEQVPQWVAPVVTGYGYINPLPDAKLRPQSGEDYKVVFDVSAGAEGAGAVDPGLWHVARAVNLFSEHGQAAKNLDVAVVIHGSSTRAVLDETSYQARFLTNNPNAELIAKLKAAGVKLYVCGQAIVDSGFYYNHVRDEIEVVLGAIAAEILLAREGYSIVKL